jgi:hypothetical protein
VTAGSRRILWGRRSQARDGGSAAARGHARRTLLPYLPWKGIITRRTPKGGQRNHTEGLPRLTTSSEWRTPSGRRSGRRSRLHGVRHARGAARLLGAQAVTRPVGVGVTAFAQEQSRRELQGTRPLLVRSRHAQHARGRARNHPKPGARSCSRASDRSGRRPGALGGLGGVHSKGLPCPASTTLVDRPRVPSGRRARLPHRVHSG